jgi:hypothetical protein
LGQLPIEYRYVIMDEQTKKVLAVEKVSEASTERKGDDRKDAHGARAMVLGDSVGVSLLLQAYEIEAWLPRSH